jgi:hypothetical protein
MNDRMYPLDESVFNAEDVVFDAVERLSSEYGPWHTIYTRFKRWG